EQWFGISRPFQYGEAFTEALNYQKEADKNLQEIIKDDLYSANLQALSIEFLSDDLDNHLLITEAMKNLNPVIRLSAINRFTPIEAADLEHLYPLLYDETKAVRLEVANKLAYVDTAFISENDKAQISRIQKEQLAVLMYNADFPIGKYNLANYYYQQQDYQKSEQFYLKAIEQDDELYIAKMNLSYLYSAMGLPLKAEAILAKYVAVSPENPDALYNYGLILSENKKYKKSLKYLIKASQLSPENARVDYNIAMLYDFFGEKANAEKYLKIAISKRPHEVSNYTNLLDFYIQNKNEGKAKLLSAKIKMMFTD
ncbi:MAG: tetratricopeptide repeat protein, partial [Bacteroidales bacterium]|nr:tetratricopeptide repeat protein [Bacteroidales bacterium]